VFIGGRPAFEKESICRAFLSATGARMRKATPDGSLTPSQGIQRRRDFAANLNMSKEEHLVVSSTRAGLGEIKETSVVFASSVTHVYPDRRVVSAPAQVPLIAKALRKRLSSKLRPVDRIHSVGPNRRDAK
jgi:hypothetical protein